MSTRSDHLRPPPITVELDESPEVKAEGNAKAQIQIEITVLRVQIALNSDVPDPASLRYSLTLITNGKAPVANQTLEYQRADLEERSKLNRRTWRDTAGPGPLLCYNQRAGKR